MLLTKRTEHEYKYSQHGPQTHPHGNMGYQFLNANCRTTNCTKTFYFMKLRAHNVRESPTQWPASGCSPIDLSS